jgi:hypothetical protein
MKYVQLFEQFINEARQAPAKNLFKMVVNGSTSEIEGVKISKDMAQAALDWFDRSTYARKYEKQVKTAGIGAVAPLIFGDNWGIKKRIPSKLKAEFKELQQVYKREMTEGALTESKVDKKYFDKVVKILNKSKYPFTVMLVTKWNEIDIVIGYDAPDEIVDDIDQKLSKAKLTYGGSSGISISGDSSSFSRREYDEIARINGGHKNY